MNKTIASVLGCAAAISLAGEAIGQEGVRAEDGVTILDRVQVRGAATPQKSDLSGDPAAIPGSTTRVTREEIGRLNVSSYGDLLRSVTGLNINSFGIGGLGYGVSLRGFVDTEHGRDIAVFVDSVPSNVPSAVQANGYFDLNPLLPELIAGFDVLRGPMSALYGNHALGGTLLFRTVDRVTPRIDLFGGSYGTGRLLGMVPLGNASVTGYTALEAYSTQGYRDNNRDRRINSFTKLTIPLASGVAALRFQLYADTYGEPGYLNRAAVESGAVDGRATINSTDKGLVQQQSLALSYVGNGENFWSTTAYVIHKELGRTRTTGGNLIPGFGNLQRISLDDRISYGGNIQRTQVIGGLGMPALLVAGASLYSDAIRATRFDGDLRGNRTTQNQDRDLDVHNPALYAELQVKPLPALKFTAGARYDRFHESIDIGPSDAVGKRDVSPSQSQFSPKGGVALTIVEGLEAYANVARGLKAPSAYDELVVNPSLNVSKIRGTEVGIQGQDRDGTWRFVVDLWRTDQSGEVQTDPVTGDLLNFGRTRRQGYDIEGRYRISKGPGGDATLFVNYSRVSARIVGGAVGNDFVTTVPEYTATIGIDANTSFSTGNAAHRVGLHVYDTFVGAKRLDAAGRIQSRPFQRVSAKLTYGNSDWKGVTTFVAATAYPTSRIDETTFFSGGVVVTAPKAPVIATAGVSVEFD